MAEGTRIKGLDERLGIQEGKVVEVMEEITKGRSEAIHISMELNGRMEGMESKIGGVDESLKEIRAMLMGLQLQRKEGNNSKTSGGQALRFGSTSDPGGVINQASNILTPSGTPKSTTTSNCNVPMSATIHTAFTVSHTHTLYS